MSNETFEEFQNIGRNFLDNIQDLQLKQIRELKISDYHIIDDSYTIDRLCYIFPSIERLHVSIGQIICGLQFVQSAWLLPCIVPLLRSPCAPRTPPARIASSPTCRRACRRASWLCSASGSSGLS